MLHIYVNVLVGKSRGSGCGSEKFYRSITPGFSLSSMSLWFESMTLNIPAAHLFTPAQGVRVTMEREVRCEPTESSRAFWIISVLKRWVSFPERFLFRKINHRNCCNTTVLRSNLWLSAITVWTFFCKGIYIITAVCDKSTEVITLPFATNWACTFDGGGVTCSWAQLDPREV